jgi:hypothetical protein
MIIFGRPTDLCIFQSMVSERRSGQLELALFCRPVCCVVVKQEGRRRSSSHRSEMSDGRRQPGTKTS